MAATDKGWIRGVAWTVVAQIATLAGGLLTIKILSNVLSKQEFGIYSLLFSLVTLLVALFFYPMGEINMRFLALARQGEALRKFFLTQRKLVLKLTAATMIVLILCFVVLRSSFDNTPVTFIAVTFLTLAMGYQVLQQYILYAFRLRKQSGVAQSIGTIARPLAVILMVMTAGYNAVSAIFGVAIGFAIIAVLQFHWLRQPWKAAINTCNMQQSPETTEKNDIRNYVSYGLFRTLINVITIVVANADRWLLSVAGTLEQVAIYAALMQVAVAPVASAHYVLNRFAAPKYFEGMTRSKCDQDREHRNFLAAWITMCTGIITVSFIFHYEIILIITNASFAEYSYIFPWMIVGLALERTAQVLEMRGERSLVTNMYIYPRLFILVLVPAMEYAFFRTHGFDGVVYGLVAATAVSLACIVLVNHLRLDRP